MIQPVSPFSGSKASQGASCVGNDTSLCCKLSARKAATHTRSRAFSSHMSKKTPLPSNQNQCAKASRAFFLVNFLHTNLPFMTWELSEAVSSTCELVVAYSELVEQRKIPHVLRYLACVEWSPSRRDIQKRNRIHACETIRNARSALWKNS